MTITTLDGLTSGRFLVTTNHGSYYIVDLDAATAVRTGAPGREWGDQLLVADPLSALSGSTPKVAAHYEPVTPDGVPFHFTSIQDATVGKQMRLDNAHEWRITSLVQSIKPADSESCGA